jgi:hypothetical protein
MIVIYLGMSTYSTQVSEKFPHVSWYVKTETGAETIMASTLKNVGLWNGQSEPIE